MNQRALIMDAHSIRASFIWFCSTQLTLQELTQEHLFRMPNPFAILYKGLVIAIDGNKEQKAVDVFKTVKPFSAF